jgi:hypothetical protein
MNKTTEPTLVSNRSRVIFLAEWLLTTSLGWILVAIPITILITPASGRFVGEEGIVFLLVYLFVVPCLGILVASFLQWLVLRNYLQQDILWAILSAIGWGVGAAMGATLLFDIGPIIGGPIACGFFQWILIRKKIARSGWWIPTSSIAWCLSLVALSPPVWRLIPEGSPEGITSPSLASLVLLPVIPALITGITMILLLVRSPQAACSPGAD